MAGIFNEFVSDDIAVKNVNRVLHSSKLADVIASANARTVKTKVIAVTAASTSVNVGEAITTVYGVDIYVSGVQSTGVTVAAKSGTVSGQVDFTGTVAGIGYAIVKYD